METISITLHDIQYMRSAQHHKEIYTYKLTVSIYKYNYTIRPR